MASSPVHIAPSVAGELRVNVLPWRDWTSVEGAWRDLVERCRSATSVDGLTTWLESFASCLDPKLVHFYDGESTLVAAGLVVEQSVRKGPFQIRRVYVDAEDNALLCEPGFARPMAASLRRCLANRRVVRPWDELCVPGTVDGEVFAALAEAFGEGTGEMHWIAWRQPNLKMKALGSAEQASVAIREWTRRTMRGPKPA